MTQLKVVQAPASILNQKAKQVTFKEPGLRKLILDMCETLIKHKNHPGVGLAAPQVGLSLRFFLAVLGQPVGEQSATQDQIELFINPEIVETFGNSEKTKEGIKINLSKAGYEKLLGNGKVNNKLIINVPQFTKSAKQKIEAAGGEIINE